MFSDERQLGGYSTAAVSFSIDPMPFPETADFFYDHLIPPPEFDHPPHFPPQKLRPIRSHTQERSESVSACAEIINCCTSRALGFVSESHLSFPDFQLHSPFPEAGGADDDVLAALRQIKPAEGFDFLVSELKKHIPPLDSTSSSSEDSDDSLCPADGITHSDGKKSSSKKRKRMESYVEDLMMQVINKQEQMHKQLIEVMEKREAERVIREEAWRRQEIELANKEDAIRAQEASRSLALISFIQNAMSGNGIQFPQQPLQSSTSEEDDGELQTQGNISNKRWPKSEVQALIALRCAFDYRFRYAGSKISIWQEISAGLANMGYCRSARKCMKKWQSINKYFKSAMGNGKTHPESSKSCPYFQELDILYKNGFIN